MRRDSFIGQVLTAVAQSTPATNPVRTVALDISTARPASQPFMAIARPAAGFTPGWSRRGIASPKWVRQFHRCQPEYWIDC